LVEDLEGDSPDFDEVADEFHTLPDFLLCGGMVVAVVLFHRLDDLQVD
jgi:hypothetical protein